MGHLLQSKEHEQQPMTAEVAPQAALDGRNFKLVVLWR